MKEQSDSNNKYTQQDIIKVLVFLVGRIFVVFAEKVILKIVVIQMGAPLLTDLFLYSFEAECIVFALDKKETVSHFNFTY